MAAQPNRVSSYVNCIKKMQLYFIRHAQSENNYLYHTTGSSVGRKADPLLTDTGWQQARCLANYLASFPPLEAANTWDRGNHQGFGLTHIYTSLFRRAVDTASCLGDALGIAPEVWFDLHERRGVYLKHAESEDYIGLAGQPRSFYEQNYPNLKLPDNFGEEGWWARPAEPMQAVPARAARVLASLLERHGSTDDRVAFVSHGGFYAIFMHTLLGSPLSPETGQHPENCWFVLQNAAISRIDFIPPYVDIVYTNRSDYLPQELFT